MNGLQTIVTQTGACDDLATLEQAVARARATLPPPGTRVVVAMSGGVDSSVVAALAAGHGCETLGVTMRLSDHAAPARAGACCAGSDIADARAVADRLGIPHYVLDYQSAFKTEVMDAFAASYLAGRTPVPCIRCNQTVKFRDLVRVADDLGAAALLTGHYVQRVDMPHGPELHRGADQAKDQSYFLFSTSLTQLARLRFPLGGLSKPMTRALAHHFGLRVAAKSDSQDICFVPGGDYRAVVRRLRPEAEQPGDIVDVSGAVLGRHEGLVGYTVGQRRGLAIGGLAEPLYVVRLEPETNRVVVGPRAALGVGRVWLEEFNWLGEPPQDDGVPVDVKLRSLAPLAKARLFPGPEPRIELREPQYGVAPGQAAVCYAGTRLLGGGFMRRTAAPASVPAI